MLKKFIVNQNKLRLDRFLADQVSEFSRSRIQKDIKDGQVLVNGKVVNEGKLVVRLDDKIEYSIRKEEPLRPEKMALKVLYEDKNLLIIDKPAGLVVHPAPGYKGPTLAAGLLHYHSGIKFVGEDQIRPGIVHRLDKDTSGAMLVAKTQATFDHLKGVFASRNVRKEYIALVCGSITEKHGVIKDAIGRHPTDFRKMTTKEPKEAKEALTEYIVLEHLRLPQELKEQSGRVDETSLIKVKLHTGRTHQIRVHFSSLGHPLAGDALYGKCGLANLKRQFLHSFKIEVRLLDGTWIEAEAPLPEDLKSVLKELNSQVKL